MSIGAAEVIATYAALVATSTAAFQIYEIVRKSRFIVVSSTQYFGNNETWLEVVIANRGHQPVKLHFVAFGVCMRRWPRIWRLEEDNFVGISELINGDTEPPEEGETLDRRVMQPGDSLTGLVHKGLIAVVNRSSWDGKQPPKKVRYILIEHSQSDTPVLKRVVLDE